MSQTAFSHDIRILACQRCGAAVEGGTQGGTFTCRYCNAVNQFAARDDSADLAIAARGAVMDEAVRIDRLREQDGLPLRPPAEVAALMQDGKLAQAHADAAWAAWQTARTAAAHGGDFGAEERLYFLTLLLNEAWSTHYPDKARPLLETALELMSSGRYRQVLRCELGRSAVRLGDVEAARAWLAPCNPYSDDIHADSAYRLAGAYCSAKASDAAGIQRNLGRDPTSVPIADQYDDEATLLRAHALELQGEVAQALTMLSVVNAHQQLEIKIQSGQWSFEVGGSPSHQVIKFQTFAAKRFPDIEICKESFAAHDAMRLEEHTRAEAERIQAEAKRARIEAALNQPHVNSSLRKSLLWRNRAALLMWLLVSGFAGGGAIASPGLSLMARVLIMVWVPLSLFVIIAVSRWYSAGRRRRVRETLQRAGATPISSLVVDYAAGICIDVLLPGDTRRIRLSNFANLKTSQGATLRVLVDPADPSNVVISPDDLRNVSTS